MPKSTLTELESMLVLVWKNLEAEHPDEPLTRGLFALLLGLDVIGAVSANEIKREIQQTIRARNELGAQIEYRIRSPWYLFQPEEVGDA